MELATDIALANESGQKVVTDEIIQRCIERGKAMLRHLKKSNPKQFAMVTDPSPHVAGLCPRRAGKSFGGAMAALIQGEMVAGSISLIISLNKQQLRRIYWSGGPSGLWKLAGGKLKVDGVEKQLWPNLKIEFNGTYLKWEHENGSIGYLLGCEDDEQLEVIRGLEADLYLVDECKSFSPAKLNKLIDQIIDPQRESRKGRLILIGTPGFIAMGPFYEATCPKSRSKATPEAPNGMPYHIPAGVETDEWGRSAEADLLWSLHTWTLGENTAMSHQWAGALRKKKAKGWADDHPIWLREYLGQWTYTGEGLVYTYAAAKANGQCMWHPVRTKENPTGLPEGGGWRFIAGLDFGYEAPTALVIMAYSRRFRQLRHVWDFSGKHMLPHEIAQLIWAAERQLEIKLEMIYADVGNLGKTIAEELIQDYGLPIDRASKREKLDFTEQLNGAFSLNEIFIIPGTVLETQLLTAAWDIDEEAEEERLGATGYQMSAKENMARLGKLVADDSIPDDSTDALLYSFRGALYRFGKTREEVRLEPGTPEYYAYKEAQELKAFRQQLAEDEKKAKKKYTASHVPFLTNEMAAYLKKNDPWIKLTQGTSLHL